METKTRKVIVYICSAILIIIGIYNFIMVKNVYIGIIWIILGIIFIMLGYFRLKA